MSLVSRAMVATSRKLQTHQFYRVQLLHRHRHPMALAASYQRADRKPHAETQRKSTPPVAHLDLFLGVGGLLFGEIGLTKGLSQCSYWPAQ